MSDKSAFSFIFISFISLKFTNLQSYENLFCIVIGYELWIYMKKYFKQSVNAL